MDTWNREKLYGEVWATPLSKLAVMYGISDVRLGKVCRELSIPLPGMGYWARKAVGQRLTKPQLPKLKEVPVITRSKMPDEDADGQSSTAPPEPTDEWYQRALKMEFRSIYFQDIQTRHKLVVETEKKLAEATANRNAILDEQSQSSLDIRVSQKALKRALGLMNALVILLEAEGFPVTIDQERNWTVAKIFGYPIRFAITEKLERMGQHVERDKWASTITVADRLLTGVLELRLGDFSYGQRLRDNHRDGKLEGRLAECLGKLMRLGREEVLRAERFKRQEDESCRIAEERRKLTQAIKEEEDKVEILEEWTSAWVHAKNMRTFIDAYEARLVSLGSEVAPGTPDGERLAWMRQQADRLDPLTDSPPSVLDRIGELKGWRPFDV
jgi:hypothetical protein